MKNIVKISVVLLVFGIVSCDSKDKEIEQLKSEAIEIHDEVMPKMDDIMKLKKSLSAEIEEADQQERKEIGALITSLEAADKAMMNWMRNFDPRMEDLSDDQKIESLTEHKISIQKIKASMNSSILEAEDFLKQQ